MEETKPRRRWFQFTIRESLLLIALAATGVGWFVDHRRTAELRSFIKTLDGTIEALQTDRSVRCQTGLKYRGEVLDITIDPLD